MQSVRTLEEKKSSSHSENMWHNKDKPSSFENLKIPYKSKASLSPAEKKLPEDLQELVIDSKDAVTEIKSSTKLGTGGTSSVFSGYLIIDGDKINVAFKAADTKKNEKCLIKEATILRECQSKNIIKLLGLRADPESNSPPCILVMPRYDTNLAQFLKKSNVSLREKVKWLKVIILALQLLHEKGYVYGDLKSQNILFHVDTNEVVLADFGSATRNGGKIGAYTIPWSAPELIQYMQEHEDEFYNSHPAHPGSDIYTFGLLIWHFLTRKEPHYDLMEMQIIKNKVYNIYPAIPEVCPTPLKELMLMCWEADLNKRPTASTIVKLLDDFLKNYDLESYPDLSIQEPTELSRLAAIYKKELSPDENELPKNLHPYVIDSKWTSVFFTIGNRIDFSKYKGQLVFPDHFEKDVVYKIREAKEEKDLLKEASILQELQSENIIEFFGIQDNKDRMSYPFSMILQLYDSDLGTYFKKSDVSTEQMVIFLIKIISGLKHIHENKYVHGNLTASKILIQNSTSKIVISGFKDTVRVGEQYKQLLTAPELLKCNKPAHVSSDIYSFGMLIWQLITCRDFEYSSTRWDYTTRILAQGMHPPIPENCPQPLKELMLLCWKINPQERPTAEIICQVLEEVLKSPDIEKFSIFSLDILKPYLSQSPVFFPAKKPSISNNNPKIDNKNACIIS